MTGENVATIVTESAERHGERVALKLDDAELTYAALERASASFAGLLTARGVERGDRVGIMLPNVPDFAVAYYGILRAGCVAVPLNVLLKQRELAFYLEDAGVRVLFAWHAFLPEAEAGAEQAGAHVVGLHPGGLEELLSDVDPIPAAAPVEASDTAVILYTSGTTGTPKGAELSHHNLRSNALVTLDTLIQAGHEDVLLGALPLFHTFGQTCALNLGMRAGACLTMLPRFDATRALEVIERDRVTVFEGVPTMYIALLGHPEREGFDTSTLRLCVSGGAAIPAEVMRAFEAAFDCPILEGYGLSETSPVACFNHPDRERKPGSIGTAIRNVEVRLVDDEGAAVPPGGIGEIVIRGENVMKGYWRQPEATGAAMRDGWFHTGDLARQDDDGYVFIVDRKKDLIIRGGLNIYPREVEEVLYEHPAVAEAAVVGVPDDRLGEEIGAAVVLKPGEKVDPEELSRFVADRLASFKYPRRVWFVEALPKGATGKVLKREIEAPAAPAPG